MVKIYMIRIRDITNEDDVDIDYYKDDHVKPEIHSIYDDYDKASEIYSNIKPNDIYDSYKVIEFLCVESSDTSTIINTYEQKFKGDYDTKSFIGKETNEDKFGELSMDIIKEVLCMTSDYDKDDIYEATKEELYEWLNEDFNDVCGVESYYEYHKVMNFNLYVSSMYK